MTLNRRTFLRSGAVAAAGLAAPGVMAQGMAKPRVVVIGGGAGGATAARYIAKDSDGAIDVTLVEPTRTYYTCFFSNLYIGGFKEIEDIGHTYGTLAAGGASTSFMTGPWTWTGTPRPSGSPGARRWSMTSSSSARASTSSRGPVPGWDVTAQNAMPHAYKAGSQSQLLQARRSRRCRKAAPSAWWRRPTPTAARRALTSGSRWWPTSSRRGTRPPRSSWPIPRRNSPSRRSSRTAGRGTTAA